MPEALPRKFGRYEATDVIGEGGTGTVYRGVDHAIERAVAIKMLRSRGDEEQARFLYEARAAGRLNHPNVATLFDVGRTDEGGIFVVQELLDGENLARTLRRHPRGLPPEVVVGILAQVAQALAHAHGQGIVHRDIKPGNVVVSADGVAKLLDFGIARIVHMPSNQTIVGTMLGTPKYMAPEAIRGDSGDERSDIYSFGALAFELLTGHTPFEGDNVTTLLLRVLQDPVPSVTAYAPDTPPRLAALVHACLEKAPTERPPSMRDVVEVLAGMPAAWDPALLGTPGDVAEAAGDAARITGPRTLGMGATPAASPAVAGPPALAVPSRAAPGGAVGDVALGGGTAIGLPSLPQGAMAGAYDPSGFLTPPAIAPLDRTLPPVTQQPGPGADLTGRTVGRFMLHERVARGLSGDLYKGYDPVRGALVGVKVVHARDAEARQRLLRGGGIWLRLHHPNVVRVLEVQPELGGEPAHIVTELVEGINLEELMRQRHLALDDAVWIVMQACDALAHIHAHGVVHREVKPRNIVVSTTDLHVTLLDSGIARHSNPQVDAFTKTGVFVGDLAFAAPEQAHGRVDQRTDVYAAAAVLYELLTQQTVPFPRPSGWKPDPAALAGLPSRLATVLERGLRADPRGRFPNVLALHDALRSFAPGRERTGAGSPVVALHGIRTQAAWQRAFSEVGARVGLNVRLDRWNFGYFSSLRFLMPWARLAKVRWFRETYQREFGEEAGAPQRDHPSIVAHSFGTYILGNALLRYPYLRFDKVLLCGSILPRAFPWDSILERGQVQAVRNEYGSEDVWTRAVGWFVPATGPSGLEGFSARHPMLEQERFDFAHSEYFERGHMDHRWLPWLTAQVGRRPAVDMAVAPPQGDSRPWGLYALYVLFAVACAAAIVFLER
jgi:serine/threonine-protein kinase